MEILIGERELRVNQFICELTTPSTASMTYKQKGINIYIATTSENLKAKAIIY